MKVNKVLRAHAKEHGHRLVTMSCETPDGNEMTMECCVTVEDAQKVCDMFNQILQLAMNADGGDK